MREYIQMMRAVWDSWQNRTPPEFLGKHYTYTLMTPNFNPGPLSCGLPKVGLAMVGPVMARVAGEVADVVMPHGGIMSDRYLCEVLLPALRAGLIKSNRTWDDIEINASGYLIMGDNDGEIEQSIEVMRRPLSFYGSTRTYHKVLAIHGLEELGLKLHALSRSGKWEEMREIVKPDDILKLAETCTFDGYPEFLREHREYASVTGLSMPRSTPEQRERYADMMRQIQSVEVAKVPRGLEL